MSDNGKKIDATCRGYFVLLGFSNWSHLEIILFVVIDVVLVDIVGNLYILILLYLDSCLYTAMYFFFSNVSFLGLCYTTSPIPQWLIKLWGPEKKLPGDWQKLNILLQI